MKSGALSSVFVDLEEKFLTKMAEHQNLEQLEQALHCVAKARVLAPAKQAALFSKRS